MTEHHKPIENDDEDRRLAASDIDNSYLVEAAAGTGKTTLLITRLLNVICGGKVEMDEIVAITFTEKAAGELKSKLRDGIETALATGLTGMPPYERQMTRDHVRRLQGALRRLDRAQVTTIHAFCQSLIRERPVEACIDPGTDVVSPLMQSILIETAWERWRDMTLSTSAPPIANAIRSGASLEGSEENNASIHRLFRAVAECREVMPIGPSAFVDDTAAWQSAGKRLQDFADSMTQLLSYTKRDDKPSRITRQLVGTISEAVRSDPLWARSILEAIHITSKPGGDLRVWTSEAHLNRLLHTLAVARDEEIPRALAVLTHSDMARLLHASRDFLKVYEQLKQEQSALDFHDLLILARDMLRDRPDARSYFKRKYKTILIDEFQDTDPLQAEIAFFLAQEEGNDDERDWRRVRVRPGKLFLVGDPKQSIYRFRRADIEIYQQCGRLLSEIYPSSTLHISRNFRSGSRVVGFVNDLFAACMLPPADGNYQPDYIPLIPGPKAEVTPGEVVLLYPPDDTDTEGTADEIRYREGCCFARLIRHAVESAWRTSEGKEIRYGDTAILLRSFTGIMEYESALRACDVPYRISGGRHFYRRIEIKGLTAAVNAIDSPEDETSIVAALRSPFFGVSDEDLFRHVVLGTEMQPKQGGAFHYLHQDSTVASLSEAFVLLRRLHRERNHRSLAAILEALLDETKILETLLLKPQGEQRVANVLKVLESARTLEFAGHQNGSRRATSRLSFRAFARWLRDRERAEEEEIESPLAEKSDDFVQIMTIHKAKGLEFEMVVIADLNNKGKDDADPIIVDRIGNLLHAGLGKLRTASYSEASIWNKKRRDAEIVRLLYVAMTRARSRVVLPVFWKREPMGFQQLIGDSIPSLTDLHSGAKKSLNCFDTRMLKGPGWRQPSSAFRVSIDVTGDAGDEAKAFLNNREKWHRDIQAVGKHFVGSKLRTPTEDHEEIEFRPPEEWDSENEPAGRRFGRLVHRLLEESAKNPRMELASFANATAVEFGASRDEARAAERLVKITVESTLFQRIRKARRVFCEVPFAFKQDDGTLVEGYIDLLADAGDATFIVDWKTDAVPRETLEERVRVYTSQMRDYIAAVRSSSVSNVKEGILYFIRTQHAMTICEDDSAPLPPGRQLSLF